MSATKLQAPTTTTPRTLRECLKLAREVDDRDTNAIMKWAVLSRAAESLDNLHPSMFTDDELTRLDRLNDLGLLDG